MQMVFCYAGTHAQGNCPYGILSRSSGKMKKYADEMTNWLHLYIQRILPSVSLSPFFVCSCVIPAHMNNTGVDGLSAVVVTQEP